MVTVTALPPEQLPQAMDLVWRVFSTFDAPAYSKEGVEEFRKFIQTEAMKNKISKGEVSLFGAYWEGILAGIMAFNAWGHIHLLFVDARYHRRGIAKKLIESVVRCSVDRGVQTITVNSSPYGVEAYRHMGFEETGSEQTRNGITFTPMKRELTK